MNITVQNIKEAWQNMPGKTRKMILAITAGTLLLAAVGIAVLNLSSDKGYSTLFMGMNSEDAQAVVSMCRQTESITVTTIRRDRYRFLRKRSIRPEQSY